MVGIQVTAGTGHTINVTNNTINNISLPTAAVAGSVLEFPRLEQVL